MHRQPSAHPPPSPIFSVVLEKPSAHEALGLSPSNLESLWARSRAPSSGAPVTASEMLPTPSHHLFASHRAESPRKAGPGLSPSPGAKSSGCHLAGLMKCLWNCIRVLRPEPQNQGVGGAGSCWKLRENSVQASPNSGQLPQPLTLLTAASSQSLATSPLAFLPESPYKETSSPVGRCWCFSQETRTAW